MEPIKINLTTPVNGRKTVNIVDMIEKKVGIKITCLERNNIKRKFSWFDFNFNEVLSKFKNGRGK